MSKSDDDEKRWSEGKIEEGRKWNERGKGKVDGIEVARMRRC